MKNLKTAAFCVFLCLSFLFSRSQIQKIPINEPDRNKPQLFADLPSKMNLRISETENLLKLTVGSAVTVLLADNFLFKGVVVSKSVDKSVSSIVLRSTNRLNAVFTFTRRLNEEGGFTYLGRIMSKYNGDVFEITQENGQYFLQKKNFYDMISE